MRVESGERSVSDAEEHSEGSGFGAGGHERDDGRGRAFVDVGGPDMEGRGGDLEAEANDDHGEADGEERADGPARDGFANRGGDIVDARAAGSSENERDAVKEE